MWIKNGEVFLKHSDIRKAHPAVSMPHSLSDELIANLGYEVLHKALKPQGDVVTEGAPAFNVNTQQWEQTWQVRDFTPDEIEQQLAFRRSEMVVTPRQARLALLGAGKLADIETAIAALDAPTRAAVEIEWEYAVSIERTSSWVVAMTQALGMTDAEVDQLFEQAATL